ncbi:predicted protein [Postia placenta Mad-698-R]|nr:predicted protein [Postia placenta Mad-698-R]
MTMKRYWSSLVSPTSLPAPPQLPVKAHITELRRFWRSTLEELLGKGDEYRSAALAELSSHLSLLSRAEMWDLQTIHDGLIVEREALDDFFASPHRLSFEAVSRASRYKSRASSYFGEVKAVIRKSQDGLGRPERYSSNAGRIMQESRLSSHGSDSCLDRWRLPAGTQTDCGKGDFPVLCDSPTEISPASSRPSSYDGLADDVPCGTRIPSPARLYTVCQPSDLAEQNHSQSDSFRSSEILPGPSTSQPTRRPASPSKGLCLSPILRNRRHDALRRLDTTVDDSLDRNMSSPQSPRREAQASPRRLQTFPSYSPGDSSAMLPFRPAPKLRHFATESDLRRRQRSPMLLTREDLQRLGQETRRPNSPGDDDEGTDEEGVNEETDLFSDDCKIELASRVVQPYSHPRRNRSGASLRRR